MGGASWKLGAGKRVVTCKVRGQACFIQLGQPDCRHAGEGEVGACPCICLGSTKRQPQALEFLPLEDWPPSTPPLGAIVHGLCCISGLGPSAQPFGRCGFQFILLKYLTAGSERIVPMHILTYWSFSQALKWWVFDLSNWDAELLNGVWNLPKVLFQLLARKFIRLMTFSVFGQCVPSLIFLYLFHSALLLTTTMRGYAFTHS